MSRLRSVAGSTGLHRRSLLAATGAVALSAGAGYALRPGDGRAAAADPAAGDGRAVLASSRQAPAAPLVPYTRGTTLAGTAAPRGAAGYRRLGDGPGWGRVVRGELAEPRSGRAGRRTPLTAFVQLTDLHLIDAQHPLRLEYLRSADVHAWRPQEALTVQGAVALVERVNALRGAPATGSPLHFAMTTGDNTDNNTRSELEWFLTVMSGGRVTPNTGDPRHYEGVQNSGLRQYWHPDDAVRDADKRLGFPHLDGFLAAAVREVNSPGLDLPWYSTVGNHDTMPLGCYASHGDPRLTDLAVGGRKLMDVPAAEARRLQRAIRKATDPRGVRYGEFLAAHARAARPVTPDDRRAPFTPDEYLRAHLDPAHRGPGPVGHGYTAANLDAGTQYYAFRITDDVVGVSLDTTDPGGHYAGSLGTAQLRWLERTLRTHEDSYAIVFSHHTSTSMTNTHRDPARPDERRHGGEEVAALLGRHRNVVAWVNGHIHRNAVTPHTGPGGSFWEISTASHVDFPQLARVVELVDNKDGTLSLFTTLVESAAPSRTDFTDLSQTGLAALYRELSLNAPGARTDLAGAPADRNTELLLEKG
ncbi:TIGR03767 family metallophosphoesterase [Streptomyces griseomycini]|uniref:Metallophosphoesterase (TIGR03767 family) n=1 Tax=Streptomyces griseomycini TaxID=66895 RepID=A0A7W7LUU3_9ACTN|nr:TIGR03767 family metallophosphoesterase [Streptomyces griseomycini]MBB4896845.1 metallophosphoesterase (TIGR03767 family) [Streptomyces griseomycini]